MWHFRTWFGGRLSSAGLTGGPSGLKGLFQGKQFYDSTEETALCSVGGRDFQGMFCISSAML